jgi:hypothetical protein
MPRAAERVPEDYTNAQNEAQQVAESLPVKVGYALTAVAGIGLCVGAVVAVAFALILVGAAMIPAPVRAGEALEVSGGESESGVPAAS